MNRTIKEATVERFHYDSHDQLRIHLGDLMAAYNFARRLKTHSGLTPYDYICKIWTSEPNRFSVNPIHHMPGPNTWLPALLSRARHSRILWHNLFVACAGMSRCDHFDTVVEFVSFDYFWRLASAFEAQPFFQRGLNGGENFQL